MQKIAARLKQHEWTQAEAASRCGVTQPRINDLLRGRVSRFSLDALVNIATAPPPGPTRRAPPSAGSAGTPAPVPGSRSPRTQAGCVSVGTSETSRTGTCQTPLSQTADRSRGRQEAPGSSARPATAPLLSPRSEAEPV